MIVAPTANAIAASGSVGGEAISPPQFFTATGKRRMSNKILLHQGRTALPKSTRESVAVAPTRQKHSTRLFAWRPTGK